MARDERLQKLIASVSEIIGLPVEDEHTSIGDLGIDSRFLVDIILACIDIYGDNIDAEAIDIGYETSLLSIHQQLLGA